MALAPRHGRHSRSRGQARGVLRLVVLFGPMLVLQAAIIFMARVPVTLLDEPDPTKQPEIASGVFFTNVDLHRGRARKLRLASR